MDWFDGGVTSPKGFKASAMATGLKKDGLDLTLIDCPTEANCAALFTSNLVKAAPVMLSMQNLQRSGGVARAAVINSGNANACNGPQGMIDAKRTTERCADLLDTSPEKVLLGSTGVIGRPLPVQKVISGLESIVPNLSSNRRAGRMAAEAIMTTDSVPKEAAMSFDVGNEPMIIGGMAKGAGMIHPNLATMLCVITTDAGIHPHNLYGATREAADQSFNMITIDRDTSTNDMLLVMASGRRGSPHLTSREELSVFGEALTQLCVNLAKKMVRDGEGASKIFEVEVIGATTPKDARVCARSIAGSNLVKTAIFGRDPNWGRIIAAAGYSGAEVDQERIGLSLESKDGSPLVWVAKGQQISEERNEEARGIISKDEFKIRLDLGLGQSRATAWGCDLSYEYVRVNSEYTS